MQTTLLGLAIAIILALLAALVGPLLIDWGGYRAIVEAEASHLVGAEVRVTGAIDARLLPTPRLTLHGIEIGGGPDQARARSLGVEFALGPLMRGEWRASELHIDGPQMNITLDASGQVQAPGIAVAFDPDALVIDRLTIENGKLTLADAASGGSVTFDRLWFNGDARSLLGPVKGEGAATVGGELFPFRLSSGRYGSDGTIRLKVNVDPVNHPLSIETEGVLTLAAATPRFEGAISLAKPVGIAGHSSSQLTQPWRLSAKVKAGAQSALLQGVEFQYGSEEQGLKLTGVADFKFGARPRFDGVLSGRQIDLDRALVHGDGTRPPPAAALRELAELGGSAFRPSIPIQIGLGVDQITLGGNTVQNLRGDISSAAGGWTLDRFEFRAPGFTQVRLSGRLAVGDGGVSFTGPAEIDAGDPKVLAAWLEGRGETGQSDLRPLSLRGELTLGSERIAVERLKAEFERKTVSGRLAYIFAAGGKAAKLDAELNAPELDIDAALGFGKALLSGSKFERPRDMTIGAEIGRATFGGITARNASARLKVDAQGLQIDKLSIAELGGGSLSASGRIDTGGHAPRGSLVLDFESGQTAAIAALVEKFAPKTAKPVTGLLTGVARAKLHATLDVTEERTPPMTVAALAVTGALDAMNVNVRARMRGDWEKPAAADVRIDGTVDAPEGAALVRLLGLDRYLTVGKGAGQLKLLVAGPADREQQIDLRMTADNLNFTGAGRGRVSLDQGLRLNANLELTKADLRRLRPAGSGEPLPLSLVTRVAMTDRTMKFDDFTARLGRSNLRGSLAFDGEAPRRVSGAVEADTADAAATIAAAIGMPVSAAGKSGAWSWSSEPFTEGAFGDYTGQVALKVGRLDLQPQLYAREFRASLRLGKDDFALDDMAGNVAGGRLSGGLSFRSADDGVKMRAKFAVAGADAASLLASGARPPVTGTLGFDVELDGSGLSPAALAGSMRGAGSIALSNAKLAGLDPRAFDTVTRAVDQGLAMDSERIGGVVGRALDSGQLSVKRAQGSILVNAGQMRLSNVTADSTDAALSFTGNLDLTDGSLDARLVLSGVTEAAGARPDIYMALRGPVSAPSRSIDVSALTGWLTLRAVDNQAKKLREIERQRELEQQREIERQKETERRREAERQREAARQREIEDARRNAVPPAPTLPPPVDIRPLAAPARPGGSVGPQN